MEKKCNYCESTFYLAWNGEIFACLDCRIKLYLVKGLIFGE